MDSGVSPQAIVTCMCVAAVSIAAHAADPVCKVVYEGHLPKISVDGEILEPDFRLTNFTEELTDEAARFAARMKETGLTAPDPTYDNLALRHLAACGFRIFRMHCEADDGYRGDGAYDFRSLEIRARHILRQVPEAYLELTVNFGMYKWCAAHPDETIQYAKGPADPKFPGDERVGRPVRGSAASIPFRQESCLAARKLCEYVRSRPWGNRVIAVRPCWGIYTEWHTYGMYQYPDTGKAMARLFGGPVPSVAERTNGATMLDPVKDKRVLDYYRCHINAASDFLLLLAKTFKECLPGRLVGAYYGYVFSTHPPEGANTQLDKVLSSPDIDFLSCPPVYSAMTRLGGGSNMSRAVPSPFHRYGKLMMHEDDSRFHQLKGYVERDIVSGSPCESRAIMKRNYLNKLFDGCGIQLHDPSDHLGLRPYSFDDPHVLRALRDAMKAFKAVGKVPEASGNRLAVVVSGRERIRRDGAEKVSVINALTYYDTPQFLWRTDVEFDMVTLEDFLVSGERWDAALFLNAYHLTDRERETLKTRVRKDRFTAIWMVAPGSVTDRGFSDEAMSDLTGLRLEGAGVEPKVVCRDGQAKTGLFGGSVKKIGNGARSVFQPHPLRSQDEWRKLFESVGVRGYVPPGNYFRRHGDVMMYHVGRAVRTTVCVPPEDRGRKVTEIFSGRTFDSDRIEVESSGPETFLFKFGETHR